jgi:lysophospholipase L1-like esterase
VVGVRALLHRQAALARHRIGTPLGESPPLADRTYRRTYGERLDLLVLGDSIAAGLGAEHRKHTLGGGLARRIAKHTGRSVRLRTAAVVGAESSDLASQLAGLPANGRPDVAVIVVGGNDVTHRVPIDSAVRDLSEAITALRGMGAAVVVGTCPDLGALRAVPQPLRSLGGVASRQLATAQRSTALEAGAYVVELGALVTPYFRLEPDAMFSPDRFHPSGRGYRRTAKTMLPSVLAALGEEIDLPVGHHAPTVGCSR